MTTATHTPDPVEPKAPNAGRTAAAGYLIGFTVSLVGITIAGTVAGWGFGASFGLGAFVGIWGGGGFGFMLGGTIPLARFLDAQAAAQRTVHAHPTPYTQGDNP